MELFIVFSKTFTVCMQKYINLAILSIPAVHNYKKLECAKIVIFSKKHLFLLKIDVLIFKVYLTRKVVSLLDTRPEQPEPAVEEEVESLWIFFSA